jgi:hypothetical protein
MNFLGHVKPGDKVKHSAARENMMRMATTFVRQRMITMPSPRTSHPGGSRNVSFMLWTPRAGNGEYDAYLMTGANAASPLGSIPGGLPNAIAWHEPEMGGDYAEHLLFSADSGDDETGIYEGTLVGVDTDGKYIIRFRGNRRRNRGRRGSGRDELES